MGNHIIHFLAGSDTSGSSNVPDGTFDGLELRTPETDLVEIDLPIPSAFLGHNQH